MNRLSGAALTLEFRRFGIQSDNDGIVPSAFGRSGPGFRCACPASSLARVERPVSRARRSRRSRLCRRRDPSDHFRRQPGGLRHDRSGRRDDHGRARLERTGDRQPRRRAAFSRLRLLYRRSQARRDRGGRRCPARPAHRADRRRARRHIGAFVRQHAGDRAGRLRRAALSQPRTCPHLDRCGARLRPRGRRPHARRRRAAACGRRAAAAQRDAVRRGAAAHRRARRALGGDARPAVRGDARGPLHRDQPCMAGVARLERGRAQGPSVRAVRPSRRRRGNRRGNGHAARRRTGGRLRQPLSPQGRHLSLAQLERGAARRPDLRRRSATSPTRASSRRRCAAPRSAAPGAEDGGGRPAHRRARARFQQSARRHLGHRSR